MSSQGKLFASFLQGGFECSTHRYGDRRRLDLLAETKHDRFARQDYERLKKFGIRTARTGARWHLIEATSGVYDFSSLEPMLQAAEESGIQLLLDLFHFGWPEHLDLYAPGFADAFGHYVHAVSKFMRRYHAVCSTYAPVNEISFLSWVGGDVANVYPHSIGRGREVKTILIRAAVTASEILLNEVPGVRLIWPEPVIHIVGNPAIEGDEAEAAHYRQSQFEAWDMVCGRQQPELGGRPEYLDIVGVNFYDRNQWVHHGETLRRSDARYLPFHRLLKEVGERYQRPMFVSETGTEGEARVEWWDYICDEVRLARKQSIPVEGICWYPILNHPGWEDDRHCHNGLFDYADEDGHRELYKPLARAILIQQEKLQQSSPYLDDLRQYRSDLFVSPAVEFRTSEAATLDEPVCTGTPGLLL